MSPTMPACLTAQDLTKFTYCLDPVSKDLRGEMGPLAADERKCDDGCRTLTTLTELKAEAGSHECDGRTDTDGILEGKFATVFAEDAHGRGTHSGDLLWQSSGVTILAVFHGMTNVGTHREPAFEGVQRCREVGTMEGVLCGHVVKAKDEKLIGDRVVASYRLRVEMGEKGPEGRVSGVIEGIRLDRCDKPPSWSCITLTGLKKGAHPNPLDVAGHAIRVFDWAGHLALQAFKYAEGLYLNHSTEIVLPTPTSAVKVTIVVNSGTTRVTAYGSLGNVVDVETIPGNVRGPASATLTGVGIARLKIDCPRDETFLAELCTRDAA